MKKLLISLFCILFISCNMFVVFADEYNEEENNDTDNSVLIDNNNKSTNNNINSFDSNNYILDQEQKQLNQLRSTIGPAGYLTNYNQFSSGQIQYYYNNYNNLAAFRIQINGQAIAVFKNKITNYEQENNQYRIYCSETVYINNDGTYTIDTNPDYWNFNTDLISDEDSRGYLLFYYNNQYLYNLTPYKLTISNNPKITISPDNNPYDSLIFYSGQNITLTYDDSDHDFTGWYDVNGNLLSNQSTYSFNITQDLTIQVNYNTDHSTNINYDYFIYIILLLSLILLHDLTKGVF